MVLRSADILSPGGPVSQQFENFEQRGEQIEMAQAVEDAFADCEHLLAEAGTGVGKSFAYLVPAILAAEEQNARIVVSTFTIALQEQLIQKDLPLLEKALDQEFSAVLGKGRGNYLCLRRLTSASKGKDKLFYRHESEDQLEQVCQWALETRTGELQEIEFPLDNEVWGKVRCESGLCMGKKCSYYDSCFFQAARKRLLKADIVVVNHSLLFSDLALPSPQAQIIGDYEFVVLDEAHTLESVASNHFGMKVSSSSVRYLLDQLHNDRTGRGTLSLLEADDAISAVARSYAASEEFFAGLSNYQGPAMKRNGRITANDVVPNGLSEPLRELAGMLGTLRSDLEDSESIELLSAEMRCKETAQTVENLIGQSADDCAYWMESRTWRNKPIVSLASAPINVGPIVRELLFDSVKSAVLTSATLSTARAGASGFDYIRKRLGMDEGRELLLASPFDFRSQAKLHVETRLGNPNDLQNFVPAASAAIRHYIAKSQGRCFVLFTSYKLLNLIADEIEDFCLDSDYELFVHGRKLPRSAMLRKFRESDRGILLGTMSFWQGVDVAGEALSNVIITKLPFAVPDAPITEARIDAIRQSGQSPFGEYQLPEAIILFKQGFGRLIRSSADSGFVVVLDHRIVTKSYGRQFISSLPEIEIIRDEFGWE
ncbi:MAG TPA: helicase [Phycisphaerae bacterium]|nr:helicase [Phycisphaerae bacterium]